MKKHTLITLLCLTSLNTYGDIGCNGLTMDTTNNTNFSSNPSQQITVNVQRNGLGHGCSYFLAFSRGAANSYNRAMFNGPDTFPYQLYRSFPYVDVLKDVSDAVSNSDVVYNTFPDSSGSTQNVESYRAVLGSSGSKPVGLYWDWVTVRLFEGTLSNYVLRNTVSVGFSYSVTRSIDLSLVSTGGRFDANSTSMTLDFGTMYTGESKAFDIVIQTNAGYSLSMSSLNGGLMKHVSASGVVPYSIRVNGSSFSLGSGNTTVTTGSGVSPSGGSRVPVALTVGSIGNSVSGNYRDSITVTVQTTE